MREMKDSGIEWAGVIPNTWNINKGKYFMELLTRPTLETDEVITCFRDGEVTLRSKRREEGFTVSLTEAGYQWFMVWTDLLALLVSRIQEEKLHPY